jgi:hypothetical protein
MDGIIAATNLWETSVEECRIAVPAQPGARHKGGPAYLPNPLRGHQTVEPDGFQANTHANDPQVATRHAGHRYAQVAR